jgi:hypothetical protein
MMRDCVASEIKSWRFGLSMTCPVGDSEDRIMRAKKIGFREY